MKCTSTAARWESKPTNRSRNPRRISRSRLSPIRAMVEGCVWRRLKFQNVCQRRDAAEVSSHDNVPD
jgi:hypothetical protein